MLKLNNTIKQFLVIITSIVCGIVFSGCGGGSGDAASGDTRVIARVNDYQLTVTDFRNETDFRFINRYLPADPLKAKEKILEGLITKNVLLQEAQAQELDKNKAFMREIERYWQQALLKTLLKRKSEELSRSIRVEDSEVLNEYQRMKRRILAEIVMLKDRPSAKKLSEAGDSFEETKNSLAEEIVSYESADWWILGDLPQGLEDALFSLKPGRLSPPAKFGSDWAVIRALEEEPREIEPYEAIAPRIGKNIHKSKTEKALDKWIADLKERASVSINGRLLNEIEIEE